MTLHNLFFSWAITFCLSVFSLWAAWLVWRNVTTTDSRASRHMSEFLVAAMFAVVALNILDSAADTYRYLMFR